MAHTPRILVVDDDPLVVESLAEFLEHDGHRTTTACGGEEALALLENNAHSPDRDPFGLVVSDINMPDLDGLELLKHLRKTYEDLAVIMITGFGKIESAVEAIKLGAADYLTKPLVDEELRIAVSKALRQHQLLAENKSLKDQLSQRYGIENVVGADYRMQKVYDLVDAVADSRTTVLVSGESGTGKSLMARAIHTRSPRGSGPFVTVSCGAIPETLMESELFGHVKGAFTGADADKPGKCLAADGGTLFIDEINSATPALQLKLLRVLQEKKFEPIGSTQTQEVDVRFVLATNKPLEDLVRAGEFREDLYYRINVVNLAMPSLRERVGDIPLLAEHFLTKYCEQNNKQRTIGHEAMDALRGYDWPGNVRELENAIERAVVLSRQPQITAAHLPESITGEVGGLGLGRNHAGHAGSHPAGNMGEHVWGNVGGGGGNVGGGWTPMPLAEALQEPERCILLAALEANNWNRQETAGQLGINRTTLYKKIKHFRLDEPG